MVEEIIGRLPELTGHRSGAWRMRFGASDNAGFLRGLGTGRSPDP